MIRYRIILDVVAACPPQAYSAVPRPGSAELGAGGPDNKTIVLGLWIRIQRLCGSGFRSLIGIPDPDPGARK
jgi:hypothetical protein